MLVFLSLYVMLSLLLSILVCAAARLFCACVVSVQVSTPYATAGSTQELYTCFFRQMEKLLGSTQELHTGVEDIPVFGVCRPACHDSSLYLFVLLVLFLEAVVLSQVHLALDIFYQHIVHVYRRVVYNHHIKFCLCTIFILRPFRLLSSDRSCSICCSYCGVSVHRNMSSSKRRLERHFPSSRPC